MRHIAAFLFIGPMLAFGGCSTVAPFADAGGKLVTAGVTAVENDPSLIPCLASQAAVFIGPLLGAKGSSIRGTNRKTVTVSRAACKRAGGTPVASAS